MRVLSIATAVVLCAAPAQAACGYFSGTDKDVQQPSQKAFITWDPDARIETFTVQPRFEGNAIDFGMVIPTPDRPTLDEMPKEFFRELAVFTTLKQRVPLPRDEDRVIVQFAGGVMFGGAVDSRSQSVKVAEAGVVGSLDYKIIKAQNAQDLFRWLRENKYNFEGTAATLHYYVKQNWWFTVMKIDTMQMKKNSDGSYVGDVSPTRFRFRTDKCIYPLRITRSSVDNATEAEFYIQAPYKTDLAGDLTYQFDWVSALGRFQGGPAFRLGAKKEFFAAVQPEMAALSAKAKALGYGYLFGQKSDVETYGRTPATLEWSRRLTDDDIAVLLGTRPYSEKLPDVERESGLETADPLNPEAYKAALRRTSDLRAKYTKEHPDGFVVRDATAAEIARMKILVGHLQRGQVLTKIRKVFTRIEMNHDLEIVPARVGKVDDTSEYDETLRSILP